MKIEVYYNLHHKIFSIKSRQGENYGKVIKHSPRVVVISPTFAVQQAGRKRVLETKQKNVHAFVRGHDLLEYIIPNGNKRLVTYDPYKYEHFVFTDTKERIYSADMAILSKINNKPVIEVFNGRGIARNTEELCDRTVERYA
jgi:hypothetical protein